MLISVLSVLLGFVSVLMGLAILLQEPKQAGLSGAFGLGGDNQMLGTSPASGIAKLTRLLALIFFALCIGVGILAKEESSSSILEDDPSNPALTTDGSADAGVGDAIGDDMADGSGGTIEVVGPVTEENVGGTDAAEDTGGTDTTGEAPVEDGAAEDAAEESAADGAAAETAEPTTTTPAEDAAPAGGAGQR